MNPFTGLSPSPYFHAITPNIKRIGEHIKISETIIFNKIYNKKVSDQLIISENLSKLKYNNIVVTEILSLTEQINQNYVIMITEIHNSKIQGIGFHEGLVVTCNNIKINVELVSNTELKGQIPKGLIQITNSDGHFDRQIF